MSPINKAIEIDKIIYATGSVKCDAHTRIRQIAKCCFFRDQNSFEIAMLGNKLKAIRNRIGLDSRERVISSRKVIFDPSEQHANHCDEL